MLTHSAIHYMRYVAKDLLGYEPEDKPHPNDRAQWCMRAEGSRLHDHMSRVGYEVTTYPRGWIGVAGQPTNTTAIRDLEVRQALARVEQIRSMDTEQLMRMPNRF